MCKSVFIFLFLLTYWACLSQSIESNIKEIKANYQNIQDSLPQSEKIILNRIFDSFPELWILSYHDTFDLDLIEVTNKLIFDATATIFYWNNEIKKIKIEEWDYPDGFSSKKTEFYFNHDQIFFSFLEEGRYNYYNGEEPPATIQEHRLYYKNGACIKYLFKKFSTNLPPNDEEIKETSPQIPNQELPTTEILNQNLEYANQVLTFLKKYGYLNLEE